MSQDIAFPSRLPEANWSGYALYGIQYVNLYQLSGSSNLIHWQLEVVVASVFISHDKG